MIRDKSFRFGAIARLLAGTAIACGTAATALPAAAQGTTTAFNIPAQPAPQALTQLAQQSGVQIVYDADLLKPIRTNAVQGTMPPRDALRRMLDGAPFDIVETPGGSFAIRPRQASFNGSGLGSQASAGESGAQVSGESDAGQDPAASASVEGDDREIVVTGSHIRGSAPAGANLTVLDKEKLEETGRRSLAEAIQTLPQVHSGGANDASFRTGIGGNRYSGLGTAGASSVNIRGLGVEETLTLVNGRRLAPAGSYGSFADLSVIPFVAVKRVEVLADGASATYGADAMAGVVNIILDNRFEGAETRLRTGIETRSGQPETRASQAFGWRFDRGNALIAAEYVLHDNISGAGRSYVTSDLRSFGGGDYRREACSPGNILSPDELSGAIPVNQDGRSLTADQILRGQTNLCDWREGADLVPRQERVNLFASASYDLNDRLHLIADAIGSVGSTETRSGFETARLEVPASNAYRQLNGFTGDVAPFNQTMRIGYRFTEAGHNRIRSDIRSIAASLRAEYRFGRDWLAAVHGGYGRYENDAKYRRLDDRPASDGGALMSALESSNPATAVNLFGDGANDPELVAGLFVPYRSSNVSDFKSIAVKFDGTLFKIAGGPIKAAAGFDFRHETFRSVSGTEYPDVTMHDYTRNNGSRKVLAGYAELSLPIVSERNAKAGLHRLYASVAGRFDHYSDFGSTFNPKLGISWVPIPGATIKGTIGSSFKAPLLSDLFGPTNVTIYSIPQVGSSPDSDGDRFTNVMLVSGASPNLKPEKGRTWTVGVELSPVSMSGIVVNVTYFSIDFSNRFGGFSNLNAPFFDPKSYQGISYFGYPDQGLVEDFASSADVINGSASTIEAILDSRTANISSQSIEGLDGRAGYSWEAMGGELNIGASASYFLRYRSRLGASVDETSLIHDLGQPTRWRARGQVGWSRDGFGLNAAANFTPSYMNRSADVPHRVSSYFTFDLSLRANLGRASGRFGNGLSIALYANNVFDRKPPFADNASGVGYDGTNADPVGRRLALQLSKRW